MNKLLLLLMMITGFLTGHYEFMIGAPVVWWIFKDEKKTKREVLKRKKRKFAPFLST